MIITLLLHSHKITYPVQDREAKNHTLSSGMYPRRPYEGVPPPPGDQALNSFSNLFLIKDIFKSSTVQAE